MTNHYQLTIVDQRPATTRLRWLTLRAPELARSVRAGQYLLVRCAEQESYDPLLRRALFVAAAEESLEQIGLLYAPDDRGLTWLARGQAGDTLDVLGAFGKPFELDRRTRTLLLLGQGPPLAALVLLARQAAKRGVAPTLIAGANDPAMLPPPFLLPEDVEYQGLVGETIVDFTLPKLAGATQSPSNLQSAITWADQICAALPLAQAASLRDIVRSTKLRWERGFASVLLESPLICGVGACGVCAATLRQGTRLICAEGPVIDTRDL